MCSRELWLWFQAGRTSKQVTGTGRLFVAVYRWIGRLLDENRLRTLGGWGGFGQQNIFQLRKQKKQQQRILTISVTKQRLCL